MITRGDLAEQIKKGNTMREAAAGLGVTFGSVAHYTRVYGLSFSGNGGKARRLKEINEPRKKPVPDKRLRRIEVINRQVERLIEERGLLYDELAQL